MLRKTLLLFLLCFAFSGQFYAQDPLLSETYTSENGTITLNYPRGWNIGEEFNQISFFNATDPAMFASENVPEGMAGGSLILSRSAELPLEGDVTPDTIIDYYLPATDLSESGDTIYNERQYFTVDERQGVYIEGTSARGDIVLFVLDMGINNTFAIMIGATAEGELGQTLSTFRDMLASIEYEPLEVMLFEHDLDLSQQATFEDGQLTVYYPEGWTVELDGDIVYTNLDAVLQEIEASVDSGTPEATGTEEADAEELPDFDASYGTLILFPTENIVTPYGVTLQSIGNLYRDTLMSSNETLVLSSPREVLFGANRSGLVYEGYDELSDLLMVVFELDSGMIAVMLTIAPTEQVDDIREVIYAMVTEMDYTPSAGSSDDEE